MSPRHAGTVTLYRPDVVTFARHRRQQQYPVLYAPGHAVIGSASTGHGAIAVTARTVSKLACEQFTASLRERLDGTLAWFTGPQLIQQPPRRSR